MKRSLVLPRTLMLACGILAGAMAAQANELTDAYRVFRGHFDAGRFEEALPAAEQVVQLSEKQYGPDQMELVIPLTNLGATQLRLEIYFDCESTFKRAIEIVESREGGYSQDMIRPLMGLGATYAGASQHIEAAEQFRRALDISRKVEGLFNPGQIEILEPLIRSYAAAELELDAERERDYALRVAETAFGKDDIRMLPALKRGARWYDEVERYYGVRRMHNRAIEIIAKANGEKRSKDVKDMRMVEPLRGIARAYRLEYLYGGKVWTDNQNNASPVVTQRTSIGSIPLNDEGRRALERALEILKESSEATAAQRGEVLLELGDFHWTADNSKKAFETWREAWNELASPGGPGTAAMETPVLVYYDNPPGARRFPPALPLNYDRFFVDTEYTVTADGKVVGVKVAETDANDKRQKNTLESMEDARYRPRFENGEPVATPGVRHREELFFEKKVEEN